MVALHSCNASVEGSNASLNTKTNWDDMDELVAMIDQKLESGNNTSVAELMSHLLHDTKARIKLDLTLHHSHLNSIVSCINSMDQLENDLKYQVRLKRSRLIQTSKYKDLASAHRENFQKLDLFMDYHAYKLAVDKFKGLMRTYSEVLKFYEWFNYVTLLICNRDANTIPDLNSSIVLITKLIKLQIDQIGKPDALIGLLSGELNKTESYSAIEKFIGSELFDGLSTKELQATSNASLLVRNSFKWSYSLERELPVTVTENLIDVALAFLQYNKTFKFHFAEYYKVITNLITLDKKQIALWQAQP